MINARACLGTHDILFITIDSLRYDVAVNALQTGLTPHLSNILPNNKWELRHTPGSFTLAAHHAFFSGFFPTPAQPGKHARLFAVEFPGSETISEATCLFPTSNIVEGFAANQYQTICIGGVGFFNKRSPLGNIFPEMFHESYWNESFGVTDAQSTRHQVDCAVTTLQKQTEEQRVFMFLNISATHQPSSVFVEEATEDSIETQTAALSYVDAQLPPLFDAMQRRAPVLTIICSDHGTAFGEEGYYGHRLAHPVVWNVPYMETVLPQLLDANECDGEK